MPLIRYRTSDRTAILPEPCRCGRSLRRIRRIERRQEESWVVEGVQVYQREIEAVLQAVGGTLPPYRVVLTPDRGLDRLEVQVEVTARIFRDQVGAMESLQDRLAQELERAAGVRVPVRFVEPHAITRSHTSRG
jgi:phenylacetate-CoA ligase